MSSIVLQPGVKDMLLADCKDFLCSEEWYVHSELPSFRIAHIIEPRYAERGKLISALAQFPGAL